MRITIGSVTAKHPAEMTSRSPMVELPVARDMIAVTIFTAVTPDRDLCADSGAKHLEAHIPGHTGDPPCLPMPGKTRIDTRSRPK